MRLIITLLILLFCSQSKAQMSDSTILTGNITHASLKEYSWYDGQYKSYIPKESIIEQLKPFANAIRLKVVLGTWCGDSKEHVPALFKIAQEANIEIERIELIAVDKKKKCSNPDISDLQIENVPTIFIYSNEKLLGKIVETPTLTLEEDILNIIKQKNER